MEVEKAHVSSAHGVARPPPPPPPPLPPPGLDNSVPRADVLLRRGLACAPLHPPPRPASAPAGVRAQDASPQEVHDQRGVTQIYSERKALISALNSECGGAAASGTCPRARRGVMNTKLQGAATAAENVCRKFPLNEYVSLFRPCLCLFFRLPSSPPSTPCARLFAAPG